VPIGVNLRSNPFRDYCLAIKTRSPLTQGGHGGTAPTEGGDRKQSKSPFLREATAILGSPQRSQVARTPGDLDLGKSDIYQGFQA
jgi:hypothetical protein